jgi:hypothetical protein
MILERDASFTACQAAQVNAIGNHIDDAESEKTLDTEEYDRREGNDNAPKSYDSANPSGRRRPVRSTHYGARGLFSALEKRD